MEKLKKGDFIIIKFEKKLANAKVIAHVPEKKRLNVFTQGTLKWMDDSVFVRMGEKGVSLKAGEFVSGKALIEKEQKSQKPTTAEILNEIESLGDNDNLIPVVVKHLDAVITPSKPITEPVIEAGSDDKLDHGATALNIQLTQTDEMYLAPFRKGKSGKCMTIEQVSDAVGKSTPATKHAIERLHNLGYLDLISTELKEYALSIKGLKHVPGTAKPTSSVPKLKADKKSGEVSTSKKETVLTMLKDPTHTVKSIAEATGASQSYIRGIRERSAKKMEIPEKGTTKRAVYDALRTGGTLVDVAKRCNVTVSFVYQIRQQMLSAKVL
jgi:hypothetical protein